MQHCVSKHAYTLVPTKSEWADYAVQAKCGNPLVGNGQTGLHATPVRERLSAVVLARWATVDLHDPGLNSETGVRELTSIKDYKKKKKHG